MKPRFLLRPGLYALSDSLADTTRCSGPDGENVSGRNEGGEIIHIPGFDVTCHMGCCVKGELTQVSARAACTDSIRSAIDRTLNDDIFGVLVDALPTLGKSRTVATIADDLRSHSSDGTPKITILIHRRETRNQIEGWAAEAGLDPHQLPRFDSDCPTANGEFGDEWRDRVHELRKRGISPGRLHSDPRYELPCSEDRTCPT